MNRRSGNLVRSTLAAAGLALMALGAHAQPQADPPAKPAPIVEGAYWHHVTMNVEDPAASVDWYTSRLNASAASFDGHPALWSGGAYVVFHEAEAPVPHRLTTAIWHLGWGAPDPQAENEKQMRLGTEIFSPLTDIADNNGGTPGRFFFLYISDPDRGLIELNTARSDEFGHIHLQSEDPIVTGDWYMRVFGFGGRNLATPTTPPRDVRFSTQGNQIAPSTSLRAPLPSGGDVSFIIYPAGFTRNAQRGEWEGVNGFESTRGRTHDHIGIGVPDLDAAIAALARFDIRPTEPIVEGAGGQIRRVMIEGPDRIAIELIEDHTPRPGA